MQSTVRFLVMHGSADDNVHFQNTLTLLDKLDEASVDNYDVHVFPDSDHSIMFHNAHDMVYGRKYLPSRRRDHSISLLGGDVSLREG